MKLKDTDLVLLSAAAQRPDALLHPSGSHNGSSRDKIAKRLIKLGMVDEINVDRGSACWFDGEENSKGLKINAAGLAALGLEDGSGEPTAVHEQAECSTPGPTKRARKPSKISIVVALLERAEGASLDELRRETGWLPHTVRAALTALRKKGHAVTLASLANGGRAYQLHTPAAGSLVDRSEADEVR